MILAWPVPGFASTIATETPFERGKHYFARGDYTHAAMSFEAAMRLNPCDSNALYFDALSYQQAGDFQRALALYKHAMSVFPGSRAAAYSVVALKELQKRMGNNQAAPPPAVADPAPVPEAPVAEQKPADVVAELIKKGAELQENGRGNEAERSYIAALNQAEKGGQNNIQIADALQALGDYYSESGLSGKAFDLYRRALRVREFCLRDHPEMLADCMTREASIFTKDGDYATSEEMLRRCVDIYQSELEKAEHNHKRTAVQRQKLISAKSALATILRLTNRANEAKSIEQEVKMMLQQ